ncbi:hypothetical protein GCM10010168_23010 [Actinoplanes ianthinogenes]|uniref:Knr4/Smi1-like domain-containing protein n=1 Tax=Actinoplanes ianthinogenes TaxID=122358 RepID=A0ABM7M8E6_9ACTN|nr:hypothetical protein [Actinoplanes ianthinogenes]BCJ47942.1 hypothetical protein Aiant_85990 [Actinoplanes ianthinogenes]GGR05235.1 hypothetical protein GCM10010168_23010 [Actinoplanes ianthinogenes]
MTDDEVFDGIRRLVEAGLYRDRIPGRHGIDLDGDEHDLEEWPPGSFRRLYRRGTERFATALANGWLVPLPPLEPAPPELLDELEERARRRFPPLLRRLYLEVGNGGFGPGHGLIRLTSAQNVSRDRSSFGGDRPRIGRVLCYWEGGGATEIDLLGGQIWGTTAYRVPTGVPPSFPQGLTLTAWLARWLDGRLFPPVLTKDGDRWRPGSEAEERAAWRERQEEWRDQAGFVDEDEYEST